MGATSIRSNGLDPWPIWWDTLALVATPPENLNLQLFGVVGQLLGGPRLADPGVPTRVTNLPFPEIASSSSLFNSPISRCRPINAPCEWPSSARGWACEVTVASVERSAELTCWDRVWACNVIAASAERPAGLLCCDRVWACALSIFPDREGVGFPGSETRPERL